MDRGFYQATITHREEFHADTQQVDITFTLHPGARALVGNVSIAGQPGGTRVQAIALSSLRRGSPVTAQRVSKALQEIRKEYQKENRLEAQVAVADKLYHPESNTLDYVLRIDGGPVVYVRVEGASIDRNRIRKLIPVYQEAADDDDLLNEGLRNLRDYFQLQGFFDARVTWQRHAVAAEEHLEIVYRVDPGVRHKLLAIRMEGNRSFGDDLIRERMQLKPASSLLTHGLYSESMLNRDIEAIQSSLYQANGFPRAKITYAVTNTANGMIVTLKIDEGRQVRVGDVTLEGNSSSSGPPWKRACKNRERDWRPSPASRFPKPTWPRTAISC